MPAPDSEVHLKCLRHVPDRSSFLDYYSRLAAHGVAPAIVDLRGDSLFIQKNQTLRQWVDAGPTPAERHAMGCRLIRLLEQVHDLGFCHRDSHIRNFVVHEGVPLIIDPKFAIGSDPSRPCYDLVGPDHSDIAIPRAHLDQDNVNRFGVWWENADPIGEALASSFGKVSDLRR